MIVSVSGLYFWSLEFSLSFFSIYSCVGADWSPVETLELPVGIGGFTPWTNVIMVLCGDWSMGGWGIVTGLV